MLTASGCDAVPGIDVQKERSACDFIDFLSCERGTTPQKLLLMGIYHQIAIALKGGPWRRATLIVVAKVLAGHAAAAKQDTLRGEIDLLQEGTAAAAGRSALFRLSLLREVSLSRAYQTYQTKMFRRAARSTAPAAVAGTSDSSGTASASAGPQNQPELMTQLPHAASLPSPMAQNEGSPTFFV